MVSFPELPSQDPPIELTLPLTLRDVFYGTTIQKRIKHRIIKPDGQTINEEKEITINVMPGTPAGTKYRFPREGNQRPGRIPADMVIVTTDTPHPVWRRIRPTNSGSIEYTVLVTEEEAQNGVELEIPKLEGGFIKKRFDGPITDGMIKSTLEFGLPVAGEPWKRGKLLIQFDIVPSILKGLKTIDSLINHLFSLFRCKLQIYQLKELSR